MNNMHQFLSPLFAYNNFKPTTFFFVCKILFFVGVKYMFYSTKTQFCSFGLFKPTTLSYTICSSYTPI